MRRVTQVAAIWGVCGAAPLMIPAGTTAVFVWRAGADLEDRGQWVEEELRRCSERSAALAPFNWEPFREFLWNVRRDSSSVERQFGPESLIAKDAMEVECWKAQGCPLDSGVAATDVGFYNRHWPFIFTKPPRLRHGPLLTAIAQESFRGGGLGTALGRAYAERWVYACWRTTLEQTSFSPEELGELAELLDRLDAVRRPLGDEVEVEYLLRSRMLLDIYRTGKDPERVLETQEPGWRSLFSRRVLFWQALRQLDQQRLRMAQLALGPGDRLWRKKDQLAKDLSPYSRRFGYLDEAILQFEGESLLRRRLLRTSVAIAQYAAHEGRLPSSLGDLVPRFLPSIPVCPLTGSALSYSDGAITEDVGDRLSPWVVCRHRPEGAKQD